MSNFRRISGIGILFAMTLFVFGCGGDDDPAPSGPSGSESEYQASSTVTSTTESTISTSSGASISVPMYAVSQTEDGGTGSAVFSIERDQDVTTTPPSGKTVASDVYRFGPDGFTFGQMVDITIPVSGDQSGNDIVLYRINETTGESEPYGATYNAENGTATTQTYHLSPWYAGSSTASEQAWGGIHVTNNSMSDWLKLCVTSYTLDYPATDTNFDGNAWSSWAPSGVIGWNNSGDWFLPQGTYTICAELTPRGTISTLPGDPRYQVYTDIQIHSPWHYMTPTTTNFSVGDFVGTNGPCDCTPTATPSVGTGDVQVTLTWHSAQPLDLDLWVTDPTGEACSCGNDSSSTGGILDNDNACWDYVNGRPENIFWENAPIGEYIVNVDWWSDCGSGISSIGYTVRVVSGSLVKTYTGTIRGGGDEDETIEVARFSVAAKKNEADSGIVFGELRNVVTQAPDRPAKR